MRAIIAVAALALLFSACGGNSAEEELLEQLAESGGGNVEIDTDGDGNVNISVEGEDGEDVNISSSDDDGGQMNITVEGEDGEDVTITGSGDDDEFSITVEGEDGGSMTFGGGEIPEELTLPVPDGGEVLMSVSMEDGANVALIYPGSMYDALVAFYSVELLDGDNVTKTETSYEDSDGTHRGTAWISDSYMVSVDDCLGTETNALDSACVTITEFG